MPNMCSGPPSTKQTTVVNLFKKLTNLGFKSYETLYQTYFVPILNYSSRVWGYVKQPDHQVMQNRVKRFFFGMKHFALNAAVNLEFDWLDCKLLRSVEIVRLWNRIAKMHNNCWPEKVHRWDATIKSEGWFDQLKQVLAFENIECDFDNDDAVDLDALTIGLLRLNKIKCLPEAETKPKLHTLLSNLVRGQWQSHDKSRTN